jgi:hypothetical protein
VKVDKQQFDAVLKQLINTPPMKKSDIPTDPKRGRPRVQKPQAPQSSR